jgi:hypothetical protein
MAGAINAWNTLAGKSEGQMPFGIGRHRKKDDVKCILKQESGFRVALGKNQ